MGQETGKYNVVGATCWSRAFALGLGPRGPRAALKCLQTRVTLGEPASAENPHPTQGLCSLGLRPRSYSLCWMILVTLSAPLAGVPVSLGSQLLQEARLLALGSPSKGNIGAKGLCILGPPPGTHCPQQSWTMPYTCSLTPVHMCPQRLTHTVAPHAEALPTHVHTPACTLPSHTPGILLIATSDKGDL